jgi:predicted ATPase/class 3 adenylate cyclase
VSIIVPSFLLKEFNKENFHGDLNAWVMYVDLTGFTPMTANLLQDAGAGAEEISDFLNAVFAPLVHIVYSHNGFIPHFAGDAFFGIFPTSETDIYDFTTAVKQVHAYFRKKQEKTSTQAVYVKIGLDVGEVSWGIVGKEPFSYYFSGQVIRNSAICQQKARFQNEGIVYTDRIRDHFETISLYSEPIEENFYTWQSSSLKKMKLKASLLKISKNEKNLPVPDYTPFLSRVFSKNIPTGEFRSCITLIIGFTVSEDKQIFSDFLGQMVNQINEYGGYCKEFDFSEEIPWLITFFGVPLASENQLERALNCIHSLFRDLRETYAPSGIRMKAAITSGTGYTGFIGGKAMQQYSVVGNFVNLAARMIHQAQWGEIRTDKQTSQSDFFLFEIAGELNYKGMTEPIETFLLKGQKPEGFQKFPYPFIGREREMQLLKTHFERLIDENKGQILIISGEPGVGKSRLAANLREEIIRNGSANWLFCPCDAVIKKPFNPFIHLLRHYFNQNIRGLSNRNYQYQRQFKSLINQLKTIEHSKNTKEWIEKLNLADIAFRFLLGLNDSSSEWDELAPQSRYQMAKEAIITLILAESLIKPLILQIEDSHWLDPSSNELLVSLCRKLDTFPCMLLVTTRNDATKEIKIFLPFQNTNLSSADIKLENLTRKTGAAFTKIILGGDANEALLDYIEITTNRNPFYLEQMLEYLKEKEWLTVYDGKWTLNTGEIVTPEKIGNLLTTRIDSLNAELRELCKVAAVIGRAFDLNILEIVWGKLHAETGVLSTQNSFIHILVKAGIRENIWRSLSERRFLFQHALLREAAYHIQLPATLQQIHLCVAEAIEDHYNANIDLRLQELAYHFELANHTLKATEYLYRAAEQAKNNFLNDQALAFLEKLLKNPHLQPDNPFKFKALILQGAILEITGYWERAEKIYRQAYLSLPENYSGELVPILFSNMGRTQLFKGDYSAAMASQKKALSYAEKNDLPTLIPATLAYLGNIYFRMGKYEEAFFQFTESLKLNSSDKFFPRTQVLAKIALTQMNMGKNDQALETLNEQLLLCIKEKDKHGLATLFIYKGIVHVDKDEIEAAKINFYEGITLANQTGNKHLQAIALGNMGLIYEKEGDFENAFIHYQKDLEISEELDDKQGISISLCFIGQLLNLKGEFIEAISHLQKALTISEMLGFQKGMAKSLNTLGDIYYFKNEYERSIHFYERAIKLTRRINNKLVLGYSLIELAIVFLVDGQFNKVEELLIEASSISTALSNDTFKFDIKLLEAKYTRANGKKIQAAEILVQMENMSCTQEQEAERLFEWVMLFPNEIALRENAISKYNSLLAMTPKYIYKERLRILNAFVG